MEKTKMKALFVMINAGYATEIVALLRESGAKGATILNTRGEDTMHKSFMGIAMDSEKELIVCVVEEEIALKSMKLIKEKMGKDTNASSVCFTMPIDTMVGINVPLDNLTDDKK